MRGSGRLVLLLALVLAAQAFYLPGVAPKEYADGEEVPLKVNKMVSSKTQLPYPYYSLAFCQPDGGVTDMAENLGELIMGDRIENSPYLLESNVPIGCKVLCTAEQTEKTIALFEKRIKQDYRINWILDNLPAATKKTLVDMSGAKSYIYETGFPLGIVDEHGKAYVNNHVNMKVLYHTAQDFYGRRIVGFEVEPQSIRHGPFDASNPTAVPETCLRPVQWQEVNPEEPEAITFTYSVEWEYDPVKWSSRWDVYLMMNDSQIHWFSIINSLMIVLFLTGMVAMIMMRTLHADFRRYREMETQEEAQEETGWKLVHGDVFRPPALRMLLSVLVGSGVQVAAMTVITLVFAVLGLLSPANRAAAALASLLLPSLPALLPSPAMGRIAIVGGRSSVPVAGLFDGLFGETPEQKAAKDAAYEEQLRILERRKNPAAYRANLAATEKRRAQESAKFADKYAWQRGGIDGRGRGLLEEFKKRQAKGQVKKLGYEDVPRGGIQLPMASFGVGGEFGVGGKYDNGERFDLRLPYVETGWVEGEEEEDPPVNFFANLLSGGKLQRDADKRREQRGEK